MKKGLMVSLIGLIIGIQNIGAGCKAFASVFDEIQITKVTVMRFAEDIEVLNPSDEKTIVAPITDATHDIYLNLVKWDCVGSFFARPKRSEICNISLAVLQNGVGGLLGDARIERNRQYLDAHIGPIGRGAAEIFEGGLQGISGKSPSLWGASVPNAVRTVGFDDYPLSSVQTDVGAQLTALGVGRNVSLPTSSDGRFASIVSGATGFLNAAYAGEKNSPSYNSIYEGDDGRASRPPTYLFVVLCGLTLAGLVVASIGLEGIGHPVYVFGGWIVAMVSGCALVWWWV